MIILKSRESVSDFLDTKKNKSIGLVPTMGALHEGHLSLIKLSRHVCEITVVSIFVNPRQFAPHEDFDEYPRSLQPDLDACESLDVTAVFVPNVDTIYPKYDLTKITPHLKNLPQFYVVKVGHIFLVGCVKLLPVYLIF